MNTGTGVATQLSGTYKGVAKVGVTPLMTQTMTGGVLELRRSYGHHVGLY